MKLELALLVVLILALGVAGFLLYTLVYPHETRSFNVSDDLQANPGDNIEDNLNKVDGEASYPGGMLFYDNIRFPSRNISYYISSDCSDARKDDARRAFAVIADKTIIDFYEESNNGRIDVSCSEKRVTQDQFAEHFIAGEGGPSIIINASNHRVILNGTILLYRGNECSTPIVAIHEIFHVLGFKHSTNSKSIMYNFSECNQEIGQEIIDKIYELYGESSLPDLYFEDINATETGRYVNFEVQILNGGLAISNNVSFSIYANSDKVSNYEIGGLDIGAGKIIRGENLAVPYSTTNLTFIIDEDDSIFELNKKNNKKNLILS